MRDKSRNHEAGIALVLALLSLMLLTFLGLALAATTSTELQIANNYRWSQQAFYNAEAGLEVAKHVLGGIDDWTGVLPPARTIPNWLGDLSSPEPFAPASGTRDYENASCDDRGNGVGYGRVLNDGTVYNNIRTLTDPTLLRPDGTPPAVRGAFTIWVRRAVVMQSTTEPPADPVYTGEFTDATGSANIVVTAEGVAPFTGAGDGLMAERHQAVRVIEATFGRDLNEDVCDFMDPEGAGFAKCFPGDDDAVGFVGEASIR